MEQQGDPILMALLTKKARISLALQGREFLWEKRNALLQEFLEIAHTIMQRDGALEGTTLPASECADALLAGEMERISKLAGNDVRLRRLAEEIRRLTRRLNVLDNALIPKLRKECNHIETELRKQG
jgi:vacuolar-type H+-ATPase subunit D/Vma8